MKQYHPYGTLAMRPFFRAGVFILLVFLAGLQLKISFFEQGIFTAPSQQSLLYKYQRNPFSLVTLAENFQLKGEVSEAKNLYRRALAVNPFFLPAWLGLAGLLNDEGYNEAAKKILLYTDHFSRDTGWWRWDSALAAYQLGMTEIMTRDLAYILEFVPSRRKQALNWIYSLWNDPEKMLNNMGRQNALHLYRFAVQKRKMDFAVSYWPLVENSTELRDKEKLLFIDRLRTSNHVDLATRIWREYFDSQALLHNGDFSSPLLGRGFGWRIWHNGKLPGAHWRIDREHGEKNRTALHIEFDGTTNMNLRYPMQIVPLQAGSHYQLTGSMRSSSLTTDQRPFFEVVGSGCKAGTLSTEMVAADQPWTSFTLSFEVPRECRTMVIRLRRKRSYSLDNRIGGDLWITDLQLKQVPAPVPALPAADNSSWNRQ